MSWTFLEGLVGIVVCDGGGKREDEEVWVDGGPRFGREETGRDGGAMRLLEFEGGGRR